MAEKIVSPGVFTRERDLSFLPAGVAENGAAIVGPTVKGPAYEPEINESYKEIHLGSSWVLFGQAWGILRRLRGDLGPAWPVLCMSVCLSVSR